MGHFEEYATVTFADSAGTSYTEGAGWEVSSSETVAEYGECVSGRCSSV